MNAGQPKLRGAAAESAAASAARREAEYRRQSEAAEDARAVGRMLGYVAAFVTGLPVPDALAAVARSAGATGQSDALRVLAMAGYSATAQARAWQEQAPAQRQAPAHGGPWGNSPDHDPRVVEAIRRGAPDAEVASLRASVAAEYRAAADRRQPSPELWATRDGQVVTDDSRPKAHPQISRPYPGRAASFPDRTQVAEPTTEA